MPFQVLIKNLHGAYVAIFEIDEITTPVPGDEITCPRFTGVGRARVISINKAVRVDADGRVVDLVEALEI